MPSEAVRRMVSNDLVRNTTIETLARCINFVRTSTVLRTVQERVGLIAEMLFFFMYWDRLLLSWNRDNGNLFDFSGELDQGLSWIDVTTNLNHKVWAIESNKVPYAKHRFFAELRIDETMFHGETRTQILLTKTVEELLESADFNILSVECLSNEIVFNRLLFNVTDHSVVRDMLSKHMSAWAKNRFHKLIEQGLTDEMIDLYFDSWREELYQYLQHHKDRKSVLAQDFATHLDCLLERTYWLDDDTGEYWNLVEDLSTLIPDAEETPPPNPTSFYGGVTNDLSWLREH